MDAIYPVQQKVIQTLSIGTATVRVQVHSIPTTHCYGSLESLDFDPKMGS